MATLKEVISYIHQANSIYITTHVNPDADGIGSQIALALGLKQLKKKVRCINEEPLPSRYTYLDKKKIIKVAKNARPCDLFIIVDTNSMDMIGEKIRKFVKKSAHYIFIDHHPLDIPSDKEHYFINQKASATGEHIAILLEKLKIPLNLSMAQCLYTAMLVDTSSFRYPTVSSQTHRILAKLLDAGVVPSTAYNDFYGTKSLKHLRLLGLILSEAKREKDWPFAWILVSEKILKKYKIHWEDTNSFINYLLILHGIEIVGMFRTTPKGLKLGLRSFGPIDVSLMTLDFGGGGHNHAAAAFIPNANQNMIKSIIKKMKASYKEQLKTT